MYGTHDYNILMQIGDVNPDRFAEAFSTRSVQRVQSTQHASLIRWLHGYDASGRPGSPRFEQWDGGLPCIPLRARQANLGGHSAHLEGPTVAEAQSFFFFSSRRRHTRLVSDWSSDVCSSD